MKADFKINISDFQCYRQICSCNDNYENKGSWNCFSRQVKQNINYIVERSFDVETTKADKDANYRYFMQLVTDGLVGTAIKDYQPQLTFSKLNIFYLSSSTFATRQSRNFTQSYTIKAFCEIEYEYICEFGNKCSDYANKLKENPPAVEVRQHLYTSLESGFLKNFIF